MTKEAERGWSSPKFSQEHLSSLVNFKIYCSFFWHNSIQFVPRMLPPNRYLQKHIPEQPLLNDDILQFIFTLLLPSPTSLPLGVRGCGTWDNILHIGCPGPRCGRRKCTCVWSRNTSFCSEQWWAPCWGSATEGTCGEWRLELRMLIIIAAELKCFQGETKRKRVNVVL